MAKQPRSLSGKVVVITGGGRGIGRATAKALVARGARVAIGDVDLETAQRTAEELGGGTIARRLDVTDRPAFTAFLDEVERELGPLDILVNNAGIMPLSPVEEESDATVIRQLELNLHAVIHGSKEAIKRMKPRRTGHIVNVASLAGKGGFPGGATYCAVKHGVVGFSEAIRFEIRDFGIEVSCVMPGLVATELASGIEDSRVVKRVQPEDVADEIVSALEVPRFDVFVPRSTQYINQVMSAFPRRAREAVARFLKADRLLIEAARGHGRDAYEKRAAASTPAAEALVEEKAAELEQAAEPEEAAAA
jgi:NAD(P)-dependent dehydrogenase (short-subunit alcohol dehydrogenase family)